MSRDPMPRDAGLRSTLVALSDTKLLLGYHYGEWTFGPPAIEAGIAACSMAQEEFGHTRLLNGILKREFELEIDPLADQRPPDAFASIAFQRASAIACIPLSPGCAATPARSIFRSERA